MTNEEILRRQFALSENRAEWPEAMDLYDDHVVLVATEGMGPGPGEWFGKRDVGAWFAEWFNAFDEIAFEISEMAHGRDAIAMHARHSARGRESGVRLAVDIYYAYWFRMGKVIRVEVYADRDSAWRAAGVAG